MGIPVFISGSNFDAPIIASIMASICKNTNAEINFYILDGFLSFNNKQRIEACKTYFNNFTTDYIRLNLKPWIAKYPELDKFDKCAFTKYVIPTLMPDLERAILLDKEILFLDGGNIENLYTTEMQEYAIAAVPLTTMLGNGLWSLQKLLNYEKLDLSSKSAIFDPGLILVDLKRWNKENLTTRVLDSTIKLLCERRLYSCYDGMFKYFDSRYIKLDKSWNVPYHYAKIFYFCKNTESYDMKAIHFNYSGDINKPWNNKELEGADLFWKYAALTTFKTNLEQNPPSRINDPQYWSKLKFKRKIINFLIKLIVSKRKYKKLKVHTEQFFADSKSKFIRFLGELYF